MTPFDARIGVLGGGAAGVWAAARAARLGASVLVLEKTPRTGTKVLASGGTRCNLTTTLPPDAARALFGRAGGRFLATAFRILPPLAVREHFAALGVPTVEAPLEKVFPASGRARDVRDALERDAREAGARFEFDARVVDLARDGAGWRVALEGGAHRRFERVIVCPGGKSYPRTGTTGDGYAWLERLGLAQVAPVPALVPLSSPAAWVRELSGIALPEACVRLVDASGRELARRRRPLLFTHHGASGPAAMDVSEPLARAHAEAVAARTSLAEHALAVDLAPDVAHDELRARLVAGASAPGAPSVARALGLDVPKRVLAAVLAQSGCDGGDLRASELSRGARHALVEALKGLRVPVDGTLGFDLAEVTAGGLALDEVDPGSMRVKRCEGLHACGEILDLQGPIGGLNFQAAFATAELAARAAAR